ncbi:hypothetical protein [Hymenobacter sp. CRA2]|uniref:hypothetical protein n=1 Tax=Hymenobacter sp. CRA2 TaxID=1955620 RepID=UPI001116DBFC|nr:hypothetical protein [Hymenobacter sp. CRA2]
MTNYITPNFIAENSTFIENLLEHRFLYDLSKELVLQRGDKLNILKAEVDAFGFDLVLSTDRRTIHVQMKTRSTKPPGNGYDLAESLWALTNAYAVWMLYRPDNLEPINYYCLDCSTSDYATFKISDRQARRSVKMQEATYQALTLQQLLQILFPI